MTRGGKAVASHPAVVGILVCGLPERGESHNHIAGTYVGVVNHICAAHAACHGGVNDDSAHEVAHIGGLAAGAVNPHTERAEGFKQLLRAVDDGCDHLAGDKALVAPDCRRHKDIVGGSHAEEVVDIHYQCILRYTFPYRKVAGAAPVGIGERRLGAGAVGMHYVAPLRVTAEHIGDNLAERLGVQPLVDILYSVVHIFFSRGYTAHHISFVHWNRCLE